MSRRDLAQLLAACLAVSVPAAASAADDAGTRTWFSNGSGIRGIGMGSAFVAAVDDASALSWNVAGLGAVGRGEIQMMQSIDLGLGFHENDVSVVLPSWRWGTGALAMRTFGVAGIEQRDDRNVLLADDLTDQELELLTGYGRAWGPAVNAGAALKLRRHALAGRVDTGMGLDLGMQLRPGVALGIEAPWAAEWVWGIALQNLVPPTIRLDQEASTDPTTIRSGIAWRRPVGVIGQLLSELDVETAQGVGARTRLGIEYRPNPWMALRAGADSRGIGAGGGVAWRDLTFDYAYQDAAISAEHRVGVSYRFGRSVDASRELARQHEDEALQQRLADTFRRRQAEKIDELLSRARGARARGAPDEALDAVGAIRMLDANHPGARQLEAECLADKAVLLERNGDLAEAALTYDQALATAPADTASAAGAARCRAELDRRTARSTAMRECFARALDAFAVGKLDSARAGFVAVLEQNPSDPDASAMLRRTQQAIARRQTEFTQAALLSNPAPSAATTRAPAPPARSKPPSPAGPTASDVRVEQLYRQGFDAWRAQRPDDALRYWELVWSVRPGYRQVNQLLVREYLTRGIDAFAAGRLPEAIAHWEKVLRVDPADARARAYLAQAHQQLARSRAIQGTP